MPKTIAITPSWYWPESIDRVMGIPPFAIHEICVARHARDLPDSPAIVGDETLTYAELARRVRDLQPMADGEMLMSAELNIDSITALLCALARQQRVVLDASVSADIALTQAAGPPPEINALSNRVLFIRTPRGTAAHSHRSLLSNVVSLATFLAPDPERAWLLSRPLNTWEGLVSLLLPLYLGVPVILGDDGDPESFAGAISMHRPGYAITELSLATRATRDAKRAVRKARDTLNAMLLTTPGVFDPGDRERVGKSFRCLALTAFGMPETGVIFAAHPQWYLDESVGIPITNAHVVPADPRSGSPIQTLWELVESAEVTVKGSSLMTGYDDRNDSNFLADGRFRTGVIASSDANGMIYILPD